MKHISMNTIREISEPLFQECLHKNGFPEYQHAIFYAVEFDTCGKILLDIKNDIQNYYPEVEFLHDLRLHYGLFVEGGSLILFDGPSFIFKGVLSPNELKQRVEETAARHQTEIKFVPSSRGNEQKLIDCLRELKTWNDKYRYKYSELFAQNGKIMI